MEKKQKPPPPPKLSFIIQSSPLITLVQTHTISAAGTARFAPDDFFLVFGFLVDLHKMPQASSGMKQCWTGMYVNMHGKQ